MERCSQLSNSVNDTVPLKFFERECRKRAEQWSIRCVTGDSAIKFGKVFQTRDMNPQLNKTP